MATAKAAPKGLTEDVFAQLVWPLLDGFTKRQLRCANQAFLRLNPGAIFADAGAVSIVLDLNNENNDGFPTTDIVTMAAAGLVWPQVVKVFVRTSKSGSVYDSINSDDEDDEEDVEGNERSRRKIKKLAQRRARQLFSLFRSTRTYVFYAEDWFAGTVRRTADLTMWPVLLIAIRAFNRQCTKMFGTECGTWAFEFGAYANLPIDLYCCSRTKSVNHLRSLTVDCDMSTRQRCRFAVPARLPYLRHLALLMLQPDRPIEACRAGCRHIFDEAKEEPCSAAGFLAGAGLGFARGKPLHEVLPQLETLQLRGSLGADFVEFDVKSAVDEAPSRTLRLSNFVSGFIGLTKHFTSTSDGNNNHSDVCRHFRTLAPHITSLALPAPVTAEQARHLFFAPTCSYARLRSLKFCSNSSAEMSLPNGCFDDLPPERSLSLFPELLSLDIGQLGCTAQSNMLLEAVVSMAPKLKTICVPGLSGGSLAVLSINPSVRTVCTSRFEPTDTESARCLAQSRPVTIVVDKCCDEDRFYTLSEACCTNAIVDKELPPNLRITMPQIRNRFDATLAVKFADDRAGFCSAVFNVAGGACFSRLKIVSVGSLDYCLRNALLYRHFREAVRVVTLIINPNLWKNVGVDGFDQQYWARFETVEYRRRQAGFMAKLVQLITILPNLTNFAICPPSTGCDYSNTPAKNAHAGKSEDLFIMFDSRSEKDDVERIIETVAMHSSLPRHGTHSSVVINNEFLDSTDGDVIAVLARCKARHPLTLWYPSSGFREQ